MEIYFCMIKFDDDSDPVAELARIWDELLDVYSLYAKTGIPSIKEEAIMKAYQIHLQNPNCSFVL